MTAGRKPTPTRLKMLRGNPGKRAVNRKEPQPANVAPSCPKELSAVAKVEWRRVSKELHSLGLLTRIDRAALAAYCESWSTWIGAIQKVQQTGTIVRAPESGFPMQSPYLSVANQAQKQMRAYLTEFGMTPSARTRVGVTVEPAEKPDTILNGNFDPSG